MLILSSALNTLAFKSFVHKQLSSNIIYGGAVIHQKLTGWPCFPPVVVTRKANCQENLWSLLQWKSPVPSLDSGYLFVWPRHCTLHWKPFSWPIMTHREQESHCANIPSWVTQWPALWNRIYWRKYFLHQNCICCNHACDFPLQLYLQRVCALRHSVFMLSHTKHAIFCNVESKDRRKTHIQSRYNIELFFSQSSILPHLSYTQKLEWILWLSIGLGLILVRTKFLVI